jgi:hypothetical protein
MIWSPITEPKVRAHVPASSVHDDRLTAGRPIANDALAEEVNAQRRATQLIRSCCYIQLFSDSTCNCSTTRDNPDHLIHADHQMIDCLHWLVTPSRSEPTLKEPI